MNKTMRGRDRLLALGLIVLLLAAGCSSFGGSSPTTTTTTTSESDPATAAPGQAGNGTTAGQATADADQSKLARVTNNQTAALQQLNSFTIKTSSRVSNDSATITTNRTIRVDTTTGRVLAETRTNIAGRNTSIRETSYSNGKVVYTRIQVANTTFYERQSVETFLDNVTNRPRSTKLSEQFAFEHTRTDDGDHLFTADSVDRYRGTPPQKGTIEAVSAVVRVDNDTGLVTTARIELVVATADQRITIRRTLTVTARGETTVPEPDWLDTAKERTG